MKKYLNKGFTLVELLIVVTLIGILAVAALSAINPIEQIRKTNDATVVADMGKIAAAYERMKVADDTLSVGSSDPSTFIYNLISADELKQTIDKGKLYKEDSSYAFTILGADSDESVAVCFEPQSNNMRTECGMDEDDDLCLWPNMTVVETD